MIFFPLMHNPAVYFWGFKPGMVLGESHQFAWHPFGDLEAFTQLGFKIRTT